MGQHLMTIPAVAGQTPHRLSTDMVRRLQAGQRTSLTLKITPTGL
jgi:hypothetical protein